MVVAPFTGARPGTGVLALAVEGMELKPERSAITVTHELLTIGRISVDIYPNDIGVDLEDVTSFGKYLGGSPSNVAVAAARHGRRAAVITRTGDDAFGTYLHRELRKFNVDDSFVTPVKEWPTAVTFCAIMPPDDFPLYFYGRFPTAPDLQIKPEELDLDAIRNARIFWSTVTGLCQEPSRSAHIKAHEARSRAELTEGQFTILDLDYRPMFWASEEEARAQVAKILPHVTVAIGNDKECAVAVGEGTPDEQADRLLAAGVEIAVVKLGPEGVMAKTRTQRVVSARFRWRRSMALAPAIPSAEHFATDCCPAGRSPRSWTTPTRPAPLSPPACPVPMPCRRRMRSPRCWPNAAVRFPAPQFTKEQRCDTHTPCLEQRPG
ncbi:probable fructokinase-2 [Arthrobacter sp. Hiyo4]|nr:probable fructokinase-2 [Arthrobacter sp. Hiyo4]